MKLTTKQVTVIALVIIIAMTGQSCIKQKHDFNNLDQTQWNPEFAIPLIYSKLTIKDILFQTDKAHAITVGSDNFCTLNYKGNLFSSRADQIINIPDDVTPKTVKYTTDAPTAAAINLVPAGNTFSFSQSNTIAMKANGAGLNGVAIQVEIDNITYNACELFLQITSTFQQDVTIKITIPEALKNGQAFTTTIPLAYTGGSVLVNKTLDLGGYVFDMTKGGTTHNKFDINYDFTLTKSNNPVSVGDEIKIDQYFQDQHFGSIVGDFGKNSLSPFVDTVDVKLFENALGGIFYIKNPGIKLMISNSFGFPIDVNFQELRGFDRNINVSYPLNIPAAYSPLSINAPTVMGNVAYTNPPILDNTSTTIGSNYSMAQLIDLKPKEFIYKVASVSNPNGPAPANARNFIKNDSRFSIDFDLELPMEGYAKDFAFVDTVDFDLGGVIDDRVEKLTVRNFVANGFPVDVAMQIYFTDNHFHVYDSLVLSNNTIIIPGAPVDQVTERVNGISRQKNDFVIDRDRIAKWKSVTKAVVKAKANTTGQPQNVKIYSDYTLDVHLGIISKLNVPIIQ